MLRRRRPIVRERRKACLVTRSTASSIASAGQIHWPTCGQTDGDRGSTSDTTARPGWWIGRSPIEPEGRRVARDGAPEDSKGKVAAARAICRGDLSDDG